MAHIGMPDHEAVLPQQPDQDPFDDLPQPDLMAGQAGLTRIVVAIHGIGKQLRSDTIRSVASRFGETCEPPVPVMPLGHFSIADGSSVRWSVLESADAALSQIGFAEVYWADIPDRLVRANDTLEETKDWAGTVVGRARLLYEKQVVAYKEAHGLPAARMHDLDFKQGIDAIDTIAEGVNVIERLCLLGQKAGLPGFDFGCLLRDYVGDVQTVTEFPGHRNRILYRFHAVLNGIVAAFKEQYGRVPEIHLVAHSEGTVIGLLALLQALSLQRIDDPDGSGAEQDGDWVRHVRGFMTIGSPIDKHIALWPSLWSEFKFQSTKVDTGWWIRRPDDEQGLILGQQIKWRNYFDFGDPVGFRLDEARHMLDAIGCKAFEFETLKHDHGYSRYWLPGKAHVDYWKDPDLFRHFIDTVVQPPSGRAPAPAPASKRFRGPFSLTIPYVLSFGLHLACVMAFLQGMLLLAARPSTGLGMVEQVDGWAALMVATALFLITVAARLPCLAKPEGRWLIAAVLCAGAAAWCAMQASAIDSALLLGMVGIGALLTWLLRLRQTLKGRALLLWCGALACLALWFGVGRVSLGAGLSAATMFLAFIYLWWLGIILFDLAFVWHRYIRDAVTVRTLRDWTHHRDSMPDPYLGLGENATQKQIDKAARPPTRAKPGAGQPAWTR